MSKRMKNISLARVGRCVGLASMGMMGILGIIALFPIVRSESYASCVDGTETENCVASAVRTDISMTTDTVISLTVDNQVNLELTPKSSGAVAESSARVGVATNSGDGYAIYLRAGSADGSLKPITSNIEGEITNTTKAGVTLSNLETNSYGYALSTTPVDAATTYSSVPVAGGIIKSTDTVTVGSGEYAYGDEYYLSFGTKIGTSLPAGTYAGSVVLSVVANPTTLRSLYDLTYMQEMTPELCEATGEHYTKQLIDTRDGKSYWVAKLKDGNCWMTQNLALDITEAGLSASDTDIIEDWNQSSDYPPTKTNSEKFVGSTIYPASTKANSWNLGKVVLSIPVANRECKRLNTESTGHSAFSTDNLGEVCQSAGFVDVSGEEWQDTYIATDGSITPEGGTVYNGLVAVDATAKTYDAHYLVGNYYSFNAATAGTGATDNTENTLEVATGSICPKGWQLPLSGPDYTSTPGSFAYLFAKYGLTDTKVVNDYFLPPLYTVRSGSIYTPTGYLFYAGHQVRAWSKVNDTTRSNCAYFYAVGSSISFGSDSTAIGGTVRCIAR